MFVQLFTYLFILYDIGASTKRQKSWKRNYWINIYQKQLLKQKKRKKKTLQIGHSDDVHCCLSSNEALQVKYKCD